MDGLGRAIRTAKTGQKYENMQSKLGWNVSGVVEYDYKGRIITEGMTYFVSAKSEVDGLGSLLNQNASMTEYKTSYKYDSKDRKIVTEMPDGAVNSIELMIKENQLITTNTDPLGNRTIQITDSRGNLV